MKLKKYNNGGQVEPLIDKEFRENERFQRRADKQRRPYERASDTEELLNMLEDNERIDERAQILRQLIRMLGLGAVGGAVGLGATADLDGRGWIHRLGMGNPDNL